MESPTELYCLDSMDKQRQSKCDVAAGVRSSQFSVIDMDLGDDAPTRDSYCKTSPCGTVDPSTFSCATWVFQTIFGVMKSLVPRRLDEPTGPFELVRYMTVVHDFYPRAALRLRT